MKTYYENVFTPLERPTIHGGDDISERFQFLNRKDGVKAPSFLTGFTLLRRKPRALRPWMNAMRVPLEPHKERSGVCFGGFRPSKHVEEPWALARGAPLASPKLLPWKKVRLL